MSGPRRLRDDDGAPSDVKRMLRAGHPTRALPPEVRGRTSRRVAVIAATPIAASILLSWKGIAIASVLVLTTATAGYVAKRTILKTPEKQADSATHVIDAQRASAVALLDVDASTFDAPASSIDIPMPVPTATTTDSSHAKISSRGTDSPQGDTLAREVSLLEHARALLDTNPTAALAVLDEHAKTYPNGKLTIERELLALDTLERLGRRDEAKRRAQRLLVSARGTIYESRVRDHLAKLNAP